MTEEQVYLVMVRGSIESEWATMALANAHAQDLQEQGESPLVVPAVRREKGRESLGRYEHPPGVRLRWPKWVRTTIWGALILGITLGVFFLTGDAEEWTQAVKEGRAEGGRSGLPWPYLPGVFIGGWLVTAPVRFLLWGSGGERT